jgi:hypothetical protein
MPNEIDNIDVIFKQGRHNTRILTELGIIPHCCMHCRRAPDTEICDDEQCECHVENRQEGSIKCGGEIMNKELLKLAEIFAEDRDLYNYPTEAMAEFAEAELEALRVEVAGLRDKVAAACLTLKSYANDNNWDSFYPHKFTAGLNGSQWAKDTLAIIDGTEASDET